MNGLAATEAILWLLAAGSSQRSSRLCLPAVKATFVAWWWWILTCTSGPVLDRCDCISAGEPSCCGPLKCHNQKYVAFSQGEELSAQLPRGAAASSSYEYFGPSYALGIESTDAFDTNSPEYLDNLVDQALAIVSQQAQVRQIFLHGPHTLRSLELLSFA
eukprot:SAG11_NODE_366_length_10128_cov_4.162030_5_plen_160_part_00